MLPGKKYHAEDFVRIGWARRWVIVVPFLAVAVGATVYAQTQPNRYRSQTAILVVPQQVPADYVESTVTTLLGDRLQMISQQILSRTRLERIIEEFNLYRKMRADGIMEDVVEQMRKDISLNIAPNRNRRGDTGGFTVSFEADDPRTALLVTERLASLFIRENMEDRAVLADATSQFLDAQLEESRRRLIDHEKRLEDFKLRYAGSLPSQVPMNMQSIQTTQMQLQALQDATNRDQDRKLFLERALADADAETAAAQAVGVTVPEGQPATAADRLEAARAGLRNMELRLKPDHPDVLWAKRTIRDLERKAEAEALGQPISDGTSAPRLATAAERNRQSRLTALRTELETVNRRLAGREMDQQRLRTALGQYQVRVEAAPARESELIELSRDYEQLKATYGDLLRKSESSKLAVNLERRQIGEQFKIVDGARLAERPFSPNRPGIIGLGALLGLALGLALAGLLEYRDSTLKTDDDVVAALALPVLALIPAMITAAEKRARLKRRRLVAAVSIMAFFGVVGALVWKLDIFERWIA